MYQTAFVVPKALLLHGLDGELVSGLQMPREVDLGVVAATKEAPGLVVVLKMQDDHFRVGFQAVVPALAFFGDWRYKTVFATQARE